MTFHTVKCLTKLSHLRPAESNYGVERALIALPVCRLSAVSQDLRMIYEPAPSAQTNITRPPLP